MSASAIEDDDYPRADALGTLRGTRGAWENERRLASAAIYDAIARTVPDEASAEMARWQAGVLRWNAGIT